MQERNKQKRYSYRVGGNGHFVIYDCDKPYGAIVTKDAGDEKAKEVVDALNMKNIVLELKNIKPPSARIRANSFQRDLFDALVKRQFIFRGIGK